MNDFSTPVRHLADFLGARSTASRWQDDEVFRFTLDRMFALHVTGIDRPLDGTLTTGGVLTLHDGDGSKDNLAASAFVVWLHRADRRSSVIVAGQPVVARDLAEVAAVEPEAEAPDLATVVAPDLATVVAPAMATWELLAPEELLAGNHRHRLRQFRERARVQRQAGLPEGAPAPAAVMGAAAWLNEQSWCRDSRWQNDSFLFTVQREDDAQPRNGLMKSNGLLALRDEIGRYDRAATQSLVDAIHQVNAQWRSVRPAVPEGEASPPLS